MCVLCIWRTGSGTRVGRDLRATCELATWYQNQEALPWHSTVRAYVVQARLSELGSVLGADGGRQALRAKCGMTALPPPASALSSLSRRAGAPPPRRDSPLL